MNSFSDEDCSHLKFFPFPFVDSNRLKQCFSGAAYHFKLFPVALVGFLQDWKLFADPQLLLTRKNNYLLICTFRKDKLGFFSQCIYFMLCLCNKNALWYFYIILIVRCAPSFPFPCNNPEQLFWDGGSGNMSFFCKPNRFEQYPSPFLKTR